MTEPLPSDADDVAWLEARERGEPLPPLVAERATAYEELQELITALPDQAAPAGWEAEVTAALSSTQSSDHSSKSASPSTMATKRREGWRRTQRVWIAMTAIAAAAALLVWLRHSPAPFPGPQSDVLAIQIVRGSHSRHSDTRTEAAIDDVLRVEVVEPAGGELRIYRDDSELVARCPGQAICAQAPGRLVAEYRITSPGRYRAVYLQPAPLTSSTGKLDGDLAVCGCSARTAVPIIAR